MRTGWIYSVYLKSPLRREGSISRRKRHRQRHQRIEGSFSRRDRMRLGTRGRRRLQVVVNLHLTSTIYLYFSKILIMQL